MNKKIKQIREQNHKLYKQINEENDAILENMVCYIRGSNTSLYTQEMIIQDILDIILSAQERGENIKEVIGDDLKVFCDEVISVLPEKTIKQKTIEKLNIHCKTLAVLGVINIIFGLSKNFIISRNTNQPMSFDIEISAMIIVSFAIIIIASIYIVKKMVKHALDEKEINKKVFILTLTGIGGVLGLTSYIFPHTLFSIKLPLAIAIVLGLYLMHKLLNKIED